MKRWKSHIPESNESGGRMNWLNRIQIFWKQRNTRKKQDMNRRFAQQIQAHYQQAAAVVPLTLVHKRAAAPGAAARMNLRQLEDLIRKYSRLTPVVVQPTALTHRQERKHLLTLLEEITHQESERKQFLQIWKKTGIPELEQKQLRYAMLQSADESKWKQTLQRQEEQIQLLDKKLAQQEERIQTLHKRAEEDADTEQLFRNFQERLDQELRLERKRRGF